MLRLAFASLTRASPNGEEACEGHGFSSDECSQVGCCEWDNGQCWSSVGTRVCKGDNVLLEGFDGWSDGKVLWSDPPSDPDWSVCRKVTVVFGVAICVTQKAWLEKNKCDHIANVFYQLLDNDADGFPDDTEVLSEMVQNGYLLFVPATENDAEQNYDSIPQKAGVMQPTWTAEAIPNSCDVPTNRGASATDRLTWPGSVDTDSRGCSNDRDAVVEEIFHLISQAASTLFPSKWGSNFQSEAGAAIKAANGDCGWGFSGDWIDPSSNECSGQIAYSDPTCNEGCNVDEGIYWASVTYIGGLYTLARASAVRDDWLMCTPDSNMVVYPEMVQNAISLQSGSPKLYAMVSDTTSEGHKWLPNVMPDGKYVGFDTPTDQTDCTAETRKKMCNKEKGCRWKRKECRFAPTTTTCTEFINKKKCKRKVCQWNNKNKKCIGYWE